MGTADEQFDVESILRTRRPVPRRRSDPTKWIMVAMLGVITACVLLATIVYVVIPATQKNATAVVATAAPPIAKPTAPNRAIPAPVNAARSEKAPPSRLVVAEPEVIPEPAVILSAKYWNSVYHAPQYSRYSGICCRIVVKLKSQSDKPLESVTYRVRSIRPGRQVREFETGAQYVAIQGGLNPGETIAHAHVVNIEDLNGFAQTLRLPEGTVLQISLDGKNWVEAEQIEDPQDPKKQVKDELEKMLGR